MNKIIFQETSEAYFKDPEKYMSQRSHQSIIQDMPEMHFVGMFNNISIYHCEGITLRVYEEEQYLHSCEKRRLECRTIGLEVEAYGDNEKSIDAVAQKLQEAIKSNRK